MHKGSQSRHWKLTQQETIKIKTVKGYSSQGSKDSGFGEESFHHICYLFARKRPEFGWRQWLGISKPWIYISISKEVVLVCKLVFRFSIKYVVPFDEYSTVCTVYFYWIKWCSDLFCFTYWILNTVYVRVSIHVLSCALWVVLTSIVFLIVDGSTNQDITCFFKALFWDTISIVYDFHLDKTQTRQY